MNIFENESNLLSTFPLKPIMIIFTNRKTKQTVNTPPKILVRTLVILLLFILLIFAVLTVGICALYFHYTSDKSCKKIKAKSRFEFNEKNTKNVIFIGCGILLIVEIIFALLTDFEPVADLHNIKRYAMYFSTHGNFNIMTEYKVI